MRFAAILFTTLAVAGCGASSGGGAAPDRSAKAILLAEKLAAENISEPATLPTTGSARYEGFMTARLPLGPESRRVDYLGDLYLDVDFAADQNQLSGSASGFAHNDNRLEGALSITGGDLFRETDPDKNYTFTGEIDGTLSRGASDFVVDADLTGEFRGRNQDGVSGIVYGDITGPQGQDIFDGSFSAEKK